jgi:hypothetical protein
VDLAADLLGELVFTEVGRHRVVGRRWHVVRVARHQAGVHPLLPGPFGQRVVVE